MATTGQAPEQKPLSASEILLDIAEDYHNMAKAGGGKADPVRIRNYVWLRKLSDRIQGTRKP
jgi:hypothetical protein